jgi:hypothetical protein
MLSELKPRITADHETPRITAGRHGSEATDFTDSTDSA